MTRINLSLIKSFLRAKTKLIHIDLYEKPIKEITSSTLEGFLLQQEYFIINNIKAKFNFITHLNLSTIRIIFVNEFISSKHNT